MKACSTYMVNPQQPRPIPGMGRDGSGSHDLALTKYFFKEESQILKVDMVSVSQIQPVSWFHRTGVKTEDLPFCAVNYRYASRLLCSAEVFNVCWDLIIQDLVCKS